VKTPEERLDLCLILTKQIFDLFKSAGADRHIVATVLSTATALSNTISPGDTLHA